MSNEQSAFDNYQQQHETITAPLRINTILRPLIDKHALLTLTLGENKGIYSSVLLKVDSDNKSLVLDGLHPETGNQLLHEAKVAAVRAQVNGIDIQFSSELQSSGSKNSAVYHVLSLPESIRYRQRRENYRAQVSPHYELSVKLQAVNGTQCTGTLFDISAGGICIHFPDAKSLADEFIKQDVRCSISLPDRGQVRSQFKVTHYAIHEIHRYPFVGGRFIDLDKAQHRVIERFVAKLQRESRTNNPR